MNKVIPHVTKDLGFDFWWDTQKLWESSLPIEEIEISELTWIYDFPLWDDNGVLLQIKPIDVKQNPTKYKEQYARIMGTDLAYPISVILLKNKWTIMDGLHRLLKADILGHKTIKTKKFLREHIPLIEQT